MVDISKIENPLIFPNEVFFNVDNIRVAIKREDWDQLQEKNKQEK
jgi:hypothetical protein